MIGRLWPYFVGTVALGLDAYVIAGMLPKIASDLGSSSGTVGLGVAAFTAAYAISGPVLAGVAGRRAARSLLLALSLFVASNIISALATTVAIFIASRLLAGAAAGVYSPLSSAVAAHSVSADRRGRALSLILAGLACGTVFGVPLGLMVADWASWRWTFGLIVGVGLCAMLGIGLLGRGRIANVETPSAGARFATLGKASNVVTMLVTLCTGIASLGLYTYFIPLLDGLGLSSAHVWLIWVWGIGGAIGALFVGRVVDAAQRSTAVTALITALLLLAFLILAWNPSVIVVAMSILCWGMLGWASLAPQQHTLMADNPHDGTTAVAANASANYLGSAIGSMAGAALVDQGFVGESLAHVAAIPVIVAFLLQLVRIRMST